MKFWHRALLAISLAFGAGCAEFAYYKQSVLGQLEIVRRGKHINDVLAQGRLTDDQHARLKSVQAVRDFAATTLSMSFNASYTRYVDLGRNYVVKNLVAAPEFSTQLHQWCYPFIGCASYRGFFDLQQLEQWRTELVSDGFDTTVYDVKAYSTLGWFKDPVMHSFLSLSQGQLVELILHELAHQQLYIKGDSLFNESFATAVAEAGGQRFHGAHTNATRTEAHRNKMRTLNQTINTMAGQAKEILDELYAAPLTKQAKREKKKAIFDNLQDRYRQLASANPDADFRSLYNQPLNNARLGLMATYTSYVPAFLNLLAHHQGDFGLFFRHSKRLGSLGAAQRTHCMRAWDTDQLSNKTPPANCL